MPAQPRRQPIKAGLAVAAIALVAALCLWRHHDVALGMRSVVDFCRRAGPLPYFAAMAVLPIFGFSLFAFVVTAGPVFGPVLGPWHVVLYGLTALGCNVALSYALAAYAVRPTAQRIVGWFGSEIPDIQRWGAWEVAMLVRILPGPPFGLQSCALGVARVPFVPYLVTSVAVPACYFSAIVAVSSGLEGGGKWAAVVGGLFCGMVAWAVHRLRRRLSHPRGARPPLRHRRNHAAVSPRV